VSLFFPRGVFRGHGDGGVEEGGWESWANTLFSIREFCELQTPIFMFDKDGAFVVMRLEQVWLSSSVQRSNSC
jgi:hypothetical protein